MRKIQTFAVAIAVIAMCSAVAASAASAETTGELLLAGAKLTESIQAGTTGEFTLVDTGAEPQPELLCSFKYDEEIVEEGSAAKLSLVLEILTLEALANGNMIECEDMKGVCKNPVLVTALLLPWHYEYELLAGTPMLYRGFYLSEAEKIQTWDTLCETILGNIEDTCEEALETTLTNETSGVLEEFSQTGGKCSLGGANKDLMVGSDLTTANSGLLLAVSE